MKRESGEGNQPSVKQSPKSGENTLTLLPHTHAHTPAHVRTHTAADGSLVEETRRLTLEFPFGDISRSQLSNYMCGNQADEEREWLHTQIDEMHIHCTHIRRYIHMHTWLVGRSVCLS